MKMKQRYFSKSEMAVDLAAFKKVGIPYAKAILSTPPKPEKELREVMILGEKHLVELYITPQKYLR